MTKEKMMGHEDYKEFGQNLLKSSAINNSNICSKEDTFLHCLFHGTIQSNYNVGPIFILDLISMLKNKNINWDLIKNSTFSAPAGFPSFRGAGPELEMLTFLIRH